MLSNEKYKGDALLQMTYTVDFLTKKRVENTGQLPQYYVEGSHPAIIEKDMWEAVQLEMERKRAFAQRHGLVKVDYGTADNPFAGKIICGCCGSVFGRKVWNSNDERLRRRVWRCNKKYIVKGEKHCDNQHLDDKVLYQAFINTFNAIVDNKDYFMQKWLKKKNSEDLLEKYKAKQFIELITEAHCIKEFDLELYFKFIGKMTVFKGEVIIVTLLDGTEIECQLKKILE